MQAELRNTSPTRSAVISPMLSAVSCQRTASSLRPLVSFPARTRRFSVTPACSCRLSCSFCASSSCCLRAATWSCTAWSSSCFCLRLALASSSVASALARACLLGSTTLATRLYTSMARVHMHRLMAALDCRATCSGVYSGVSMYFFNCLMVRSGMLSLSYSLRFLRKSLLLRTFFAVSQSVFSPSSTHTASMVSATSGGGLGKDLISVMSPLLSALRESTAACSAGMASSRSALASSAMILVSSACALTSASSTPTRLATCSASSWSLVTLIRSSAVALLFSSRIGWSSPSSFFIESTTSFVSASLVSPFKRRSLAVPNSSRFSAIRLTYRLIRSKYDFGVV
mmetsp:Transcript_5661/g.19189  ORF Transcript_5661/g.19189 Transcript_5661/m.19189 type:complete len:343 (+) Transcript_5661:1654-2682(+)